MSEQQPPARRRVQKVFDHARGRTHQSFRDEVDINKLVQAYANGGQLPSGRDPKAARYGDFTHVGEYHEALNQVVSAQADFDALPAEVRDYFENDPAQLLQGFDEAAENAAVRDDLIELGVWPREVPEVPAPANAAPEAPEAAPESPAESSPPAPEGSSPSPTEQ